MTDITDLKNALRQFRDERNWQQFHTLKDLIISVNLEAAELLELTQWKSDAQLEQLKTDPAFQEQLQDECADVLLYLLQLADAGGFDLIEAAQQKIGKNARRYPIAQAYGSATKSTEFPSQEDLHLP